jgi:hypothetical protein
MSTLKMPPTVVIDAKHPLLKAKEMLPPDEDPLAVIGRTSLPTLPVNGGWQSVWFALVVVDVEEIVDVVEVEVEKVVVVSVDSNIDDVELSSLAADAPGAAAAGVPGLGAYWFCAYAAIPPETRTSIAATVRICSLPAFTCMLLRTLSPRRNIMSRIQEVEFQKSLRL